MKHSDYSKLIKRFRDADRTVALLTMPLFVTGNGSIVATESPNTDWAPFDCPRGDLSRAVADLDNDTSQRMDSLLDGFLEEIQGRADNELAPTADIRALYETMSGFMSATSTPGKVQVLFNKTRQRVRAWMDHVKEVFPGIDNEESDRDNQTKSSRATPTIDRDKLGALFQAKYKQPQPGPDPRNPLASVFEYFYNAVASGADNYSLKDFGRIAFQLQHSGKVLSKYKPNMMPFSKFARCFFDACGIDPPKDLAPTRYSKETRKTDYSHILK